MPRNAIERRWENPQFGLEMNEFSDEWLRPDEKMFETIERLIWDYHCSRQGESDYICSFTRSIGRETLRKVHEACVLWSNAVRFRFRIEPNNV